MSIRGGRGLRALWVAVALALLLGPALPVGVAQSPADPWWGPSDRAKPTEGYAIRVPIVVENRFAHPLVDPFLAVELDLGKLLVDAGWTNATASTGVAPRGFTLDPDSLRVVPYARGFTSGPRDGAATRPLPHRFYPDLFEGERARTFSATNPAGTLLFQHEGTLDPGAKLYYYVYASPLEFSKAQPAKHDPLETSPLDAFMWGTRGNVYYGYTPLQEGQGHAIKIRALGPGSTTAVVAMFELNRYVPLPSTQAFSNPITLQGASEREVTVPAGKFFRIEADRPIIVATRGDTSPTGVGEVFGYVPGRSGSFADDAFDVYGWMSGGSSSFVRVIKAGPGSVTITGGLRSVTLNAADPVQNVPISSSTWSTLVGNGKFLVSLQSRTQLPTDSAPSPFHTHQVPSVTGGPTGTGFFTFIQSDNGFLRLCAADNSSVRIVNYGDGGNYQIHPEGSLPNVPPAIIGPQRLCERITIPRVADTQDVHEIYAIPPATGRDPVPVSVVIGTGPRFDNNAQPVTNLTRGAPGQHFGGPGGVDYRLDGSFVVFGHYNHTRVTIHEERLRDGQLVVTNRTESLQRDGILQYPDHKVPDGATGRVRIVATKPVAVGSLDPAVFEQQGDGITPSFRQNIPYARVLPGRPAMPDIEVGKLEFRGPLVELRSAAKPLVRLDSVTTGPGSPLQYRLDLYNLGRWVGNSDLPDTVTVSCATPVGWTIEGCNRDVTLSSGSAQRLDVVVTPPAEDVGETVPIEITARSKAGGAASVFTLRVRVSIVYGVGMWFDLEGGRKTIDPPIGLDPGQTHRYNVVVKNTGSTTDTIAFTMDPPQEGWTQTLLRDNEPVTSIRLDGSESAVLQFVVTAPNLETARPNIVTIVAQSQASALAADVVNTATRIKPKVDLTLVLTPQTRLAAPNETTAFNLTLCNKGNDIFTIFLRQDSVLPKDWKANFSTERIGNEITLNRNPGCADPLENITVQLFVTPPAGARAGDLASAKIAAEIDTGGAGGRIAGDEVSAVVVVRRIYNLTTPALGDIVAQPGAQLRLGLPIENEGNGQVGVELLPGAVEATLLGADGAARVVPGWRVQLETEGLTLAHEERADVQLRVDVPTGAPPGIYNLTFTTRLSREATQNLTIPVDVQALARVELEGVERVAFPPGRPITVPVVARNTGNVEGVFALRAAAPTGWIANVSPPSVRLAPGQSANAILTLGAPRDTPNGEHDVELSTAMDGHEPTARTLAASLGRPELYLGDVSASGAVRPGELVLVTAIVGNRGGIAADNVSVAMLVDDRVVDKVTLSRIPIGSTSLATMSWVATQRGGDVRVVIDPDQEIALADRGAAATERTVEFGSILGAPGPGLGLVAAALLAGVALRRRWGS